MKFSKDFFLSRLEIFDSYIQNEKMIVGYLHLGSLGQGNFDEFSDYDILLIANEENISKFKKRKL